MCQSLFRIKYLTSICDFLRFPLTLPLQRELEAGDEIFLNYGYCNSDDVDDVEDEGSNYPEWAAFIPQHAHFKTAAKITPFWWKRLQTLRDLKSISIGR